MDEMITQLIAVLGTIALIAVTYAETFGARQTEITEAVVNAFNVRKRYKPVVNVATSVAVAGAIGGVLWIFSTWEVIPVMLLAGLLASTKAATVHDDKKTDDHTAETGDNTLEAPPAK